MIKSSPITANSNWAKFSGAGNTFVLGTQIPPDIARWCSALGVDGLIVVEESQIAEFHMRIFNSDGSEARGCGNGTRCFKAYLATLGYDALTYSIEVGGRILHATTLPDGQVRVAMGQIAPPRFGSYDLIDTGAPHVVVYDRDFSQAPSIRHDPQFAPEGVNVNFVTITGPRSISLRTFEKGVEAETQACGTGATAAAISAAHRLQLCSGPIEVEVASGDLLTIEFNLDGTQVSDLYLTGPVASEGEIG